MVKAVEVPVTVKIRAGWDAGSLSAVEIARRAADCGVAGVTVHARHAMQGMSGLADWQIITCGPGRARGAGHRERRRDQSGRGTPDAGRDGMRRVMIGRPPWARPGSSGRVEHELRTGLPLPEPDRSERATVALHHARKMLLTTRIPASRAIRKLRGQLLPYALIRPERRTCATPWSASKLRRS